MNCPKCGHDKVRINEVSHKDMFFALCLKCYFYGYETGNKEEAYEKMLRRCEDENTM